MTDDNLAGVVMDEAAQASPRALFAALQAAVLAIISSAPTADAKNAALSVVLEALRVGAPFGSPEQLAHAEAKRR